MITKPKRRSSLVLVLISLVIAAAITGGATAAPDDRGTTTNGDAAGAISSACTGTSGGGCGTAGKALDTPKELTTTLYAKTLKGGYVAKGVAMRNRGFGNIVINKLPPNSTVDKAYLFWAVISPDTVTGVPPAAYGRGKINGVLITGTLLGSDEQPCWSGGGKIYSYRADVTALVKGNKTYSLTGFASGRTDGADPHLVLPTKFPVIEGASLVIVYSNIQYPSTRVIIKNGVETFINTTGTTTFSGLPAYTNPVVYTTWIVADGQSNADKKVTFNGVMMPKTFIDGNDTQNGPNFSSGNLWDTQNALVTMTPGATTVSTTITSLGPNYDCVTWVAQVLSVSDGDADTDGDALLDSWETYGYDYKNDGTIDVDLPGLGASPFHKDLFVWIDYMTGHQPNASVLTRSVATFADAPFANNPDGKPGITLHNYLDAQVSHVTNLNPPFGAQFLAIKNAHFPVRKRAVYHYCLFAHGYGSSKSSGISDGIPASQFIVSLGTWGAGDTPDAETGTYIHEFGHNLGLRHGGTDDINYKPNYLSIMNYYFQISGLYRDASWGNYDYQRIAPYTLNENSLLEANGVGTAAAGYGTEYRCPNRALRTILTNKPINWSCNKTIDPFPVRVDINNDSVKTTLTSQNNWQNIVYNGGDVGGISAGRSKTQMLTAEHMQELTYEEYLAHAKAANE